MDDLRILRKEESTQMNYPKFSVIQCAAALIVLLLTACGGGGRK
jgi:hypothetical protein